MAARRSCLTAIRSAPDLTAISVSPGRSHREHSPAGRSRHPSRANGHIAIVAAVSPSAQDRAAARRIADTAFREIYVATPADVCESRDPKGHYAKARAGALHAFTGIGNDYQPPAASELTIDTSTCSVVEATDEIERMLARTGILFDELVDLAANI